MPDLTWHISQECAELRKTHTVLVPSDSNPKRNYTVTVLGDGDSHACTCPGHKFHGRCKHVERARQQFCTWHMDYSPQVQSLQQNVNCVCPACGGPTELVRVAE